MNRRESMGAIAAAVVVAAAGSCPHEQYVRTWEERDPTIRKIYPHWVAGNPPLRYWYQCTGCGDQIMHGQSGDAHDLEMDERFMEILSQKGRIA